MKKTIFIILVLFLVNNLVAQTKKAIMLNSGLSIPSSTEYFSDYWTAGFNFGGGFDFYLNSQLALQGYIDYNSFSPDVQKAMDKSQSSGQASGGTISVLNLGANVKYHLTDMLSSQKVSPYILGGLGLSSHSCTDLVVRDRSGSYSYTISSKSISALSINFGFGAEYAVSPSISIFADARYVISFTDGVVSKFTQFDNRSTKEGSYTLKGNINYIPLRVGVSYSF